MALDASIERKLLALKEMAERGTENEAIVASQKLQELCLKYGIDSGELEKGDSFSVEILDHGKALPKWKKVLATAIALGSGAYCFCSRRNGESLIRVSGLDYQQTIVATQYRHLVAIIERLAKENTKGRSNRHDYKMGVSVTLHDRLVPKKRNDRSQVESPSQVEGLILLSKAIDRAKHHAETIAGRIGSSSAKVRLSGAYLAGQQAGRNLSTNAPLGNGYSLPAAR